MLATPDFLGRLELAPDADERDVRRAYARALKQVDQERDLEGFQHLRACYEAALAWVTRRDASGKDASDDGQPASTFSHVAEPERASPTSQELAAAVFKGFSARLAQLSARPDQPTSDDATRIAPWTGALEEALADPRLLNLDARLMFEHGVAVLLSDGWQPGHHLLLVAASRKFGWGEDRQALRRLGYPGAVLDAALDQRDMFDAQTPQARSQQRDVLNLLRGPAMPGLRVIRNRIRALRMLETRFPVLLHVVAPSAAVARWHELAVVATSEVAASTATPPATQDAKWDPPNRFGIGFVTMLLVVGLSRLMNDTLDSPPRYQPPITIDVPPSPSLPPPPARPGPSLSEERLRQIEKRIVYRPGRNVLPGEQRVLLKVRLDRAGTIFSIERLEVTGDPAYAALVERAVRDSGPYPPDTPRVFEIGYRVTVEPRVERKPPAQEWQSSQPSAPAAPGWPPAPPRRREANAEMDTILRNPDQLQLRAPVAPPAAPGDVPTSD